MDTKIRILYDNRSVGQKFKAAWGFSVLIEAGGLKGFLHINSGVRVYLPHPVNQNIYEWGTGQTAMYPVKTYTTISNQRAVIGQPQTLSLALDDDQHFILFASRIPEYVLDMIRNVRRHNPKPIDLVVAGFCLCAFDDTHTNRHPVFATLV